MSTEQKAMEDVIRIGERMAIVCHNLSQCEEHGPSDQDVMRDLSDQWASAVREYRKLAKKAME